MPKRRVARSDLQIGVALWWDVYDDQDRLLLCKGHIVATERQLEALLERGLFVDQNDYTQALVIHQDPVKVVEFQSVSVIRLINQTHAQLASVLAAIAEDSAPADAESQVVDAANAIIQAVKLDGDIALAWIHFTLSTRGYAVRHSIQAAILSVSVCLTMKKPEPDLTVVAAAALTMNLGMLSLQDRLQHKEDSLDADEFAAVRQHPRVSVDLLRTAGISDQKWLAYVLSHHENVDGSGYPHGRSGVEIPEYAQVISLADRYTARIVPRSYRAGLAPNEALRSLLLERGKSVDSEIAAYFIRTLGIYPPGMLVRLFNGEIAVVYKRGNQGTTPPVMSVLCPRGAPFDHPVRRDTGHNIFGIRSSVAMDSVDIPFDMCALWGQAAAS